MYYGNMENKNPVDRSPENNIQIIRSGRKTLSLEIKPDASIVVRAPRRAGREEIERFIIAHEDWIRTHLEMVQERIKHQPEVEKLSSDELRALAEQAGKIIPRKVSKYAAMMKVDYGRITIRNQHTRWGSCSSKGNLNFNCLLMLCPEAVLDYVVVHELCHRIEMNHSSRFWAQVENVLPDYKISRQWLKDHGHEIMCRNI